MLLTRVTFCIVLFCVICAFCLLTVLVRLSVPVQVIDWKDSSPILPIKMLVGTLNPTHSLTHLSQDVAGDDVCSVSGAVYDVLTYVHPVLVVPHDGMKFTTPDVDNDTNDDNCAVNYGGGFWYNVCALINPTTDVMNWFNLADSTWPTIKNFHMMIKLQ